MREKKYHLYLTADEQSKVIQSLIDLKNNLIAQGRYRIEKLFIINIEREIRNNEIVIDVRKLFFEFIDAATA